MMHDDQVCPSINGKMSVGFLIFVMLLTVFLTAVEYEHHCIHTLIGFQPGNLIPCPVAVAVKLGGVQAEESDFHTVFLIDVGGLLPEVANAGGIQGGLSGFIPLLAEIIGVVVGQVAGFHTAFQQNVHIIRGSPETIVFFCVLLGALVRQGTFQIYHGQVILRKKLLHLSEEVGIPFLCCLGDKGRGLILLGFLTAQGHIPSEGHSNGLLSQCGRASQHEAEKETQQASLHDRTSCSLAGDFYTVHFHIPIGKDDDVAFSIQNAGLN